MNRKEKLLIIFLISQQIHHSQKKQKLSRDVNVPIQLKDVLKTTGENWYDKLVRDEVTVFERESKLTVKLVSDKTEKRLKIFLKHPHI
ncbi:MAG: hypothetical protein IPH96_18175 [Saprospiraceae bacterium]|nr:hypothetical protein [Saprospiraceae bacterium]